MVLPGNGKLVRDRIPQVIEAAGGVPNWFVIERELLRQALDGKLTEEVGEYLDAASEVSRLEELADVLEVIRGLLAEMNLSLDDLLAVADKKCAERGGFEQGVWLA